MARPTLLLPMTLATGALVAACASAAPRATPLADPSASASASPAASSPPDPVATAAAPPSAPPSGMATAAPTAAPTPTTAPTTAKPAASKFMATATFDDPKFEGGEIADVKETLEKLKKKAEKCVDDGGGVGEKGATIKIQFLVRAKGIAEGIDVLDASGLDEKPGKCVRDVFKKKTIGTPSSDPVGVTFTITFTADPSRPAAAAKQDK